MQEKVNHKHHISLPIHKAKQFLALYERELSDEASNALKLYIEDGAEADENMSSWVIEKIQNECAQGVMTVLENKPLGEDELKALGEQERNTYLSKLWVQYTGILDYLAKISNEVQENCWVTFYEEAFELHPTQKIETFLETMEVEPGAIHAIMKGLVDNYDAGGYQLTLKRDVHAYQADEGLLIAELDHDSLDPYEAYFPTWIDKELLGRLVARSGKTLFELFEVDEKDIDFLLNTPDSELDDD